MRVELAMDEPGAVAPSPPRRRFRRLDRFDLALLTVFGMVSLWVLALDAWQVVGHGRIWTGTDGVYIVDQLQYLAWIRDASRHLFASNLFVLRPTPADYFQPAVALSGGLSALGVVPWLTLLLWKPVAVGGCFFAVRAYVRNSMTGLWSRRAALTLALFFASFTVLYGKLTVLGDLFPAFLSWGYTFALLAIAAIVAALVAYGRARDRQRLSYIPALLGALASMLHPWQGELLILILIGAEMALWRRRGRPALALPVLTLIGTGLPLLYYLVLGHLDLSWQLARQASKHSFSIWPILIYIAPLLLPALFAYRRPIRGFLDAATRSWPIASFVVFVLSVTAAGASPLHAFAGITIPLAVLAVQGVQTEPFLSVVRRLQTARLRGRGQRRTIALAIVALAIVPGAVYQLNLARQLALPTRDNANFIDRDERNALDYLADRKEPGGVLTRSYLGALVPSRTGRHTLVGDCLWSEPECLKRGVVAKRLFAGTLGPRNAKLFVRRSGARFLLADCKTQVDLPRVLGSMVVGVKQFGCASVVEVDAPGPPTGPLADLRADAVVRAPRGK
ncbi:MAG: hypothetical protein QOD66_1416 [Solirubrobacteraceae bacterium]|nr:hypothetical protein [Solirubrobacteraceae bacterium]